MHLFFISVYIQYMYIYGNKIDNMEKNLNSVNYFTNFDFSKFINEKNVNVYVKRYREKKQIFRIKQWIYVSKERVDYIDKLWKRDEYINFLATNVINNSSYISGPYILSLNNITVESAFVMTLITTKKTSTIKNDFWTFIYQNINDNLFWWYERVEDFWFIYYRALPEKALLDWLRLKKDIFYSIDYFRELRLNLDLLDFNRLGKFVKKFNKKKITKCFNYLKELSWY